MPQILCLRNWQLRRTMPQILCLRNRQLKNYASNPLPKKLAGKKTILCLRNWQVRKSMPQILFKKFAVKKKYASNPLLMKSASKKNYASNPKQNKLGIKKWYRKHRSIVLQHKHSRYYQSIVHRRAARLLYHSLNRVKCTARSPGHRNS